jgi:glutathionylspermidine synthase
MVSLLLHSVCTTHAQRIAEDLREEIRNAKKKLEEVTTELHEMTLKWMETVVALRTERLVNEISRNYIPEDKLDELDMALPSRQLVWD